MNKIRKNFERFCLKNRNKGIPNLMLYIAIGCGIISLMQQINGGANLVSYLEFDKAAILQGQVWRLFGAIFSYSFTGVFLLDIVFLFFFYRLGSAVEQAIGTLKFNLFYFGGVLLMSTFAMIFCPTTDIIVGNYLVTKEFFTKSYGQMTTFLHLSLILAFATSYPDAQFTVMFLIPVKARILALIDLVIIGIQAANMCFPAFLFPHCLFPLVSILNYFIFFDVKNLLPLSWQMRLNRKKQAKARTEKAPKPGPKVVEFQGRPAPKADYTHRCTSCGRTDTSNPELEFRYCSRCKGYYCYCEDHISNHTHIE